MLMEKSNRTRGVRCDDWIPYISWVPGFFSDGLPVIEGIGISLPPPERGPGGQDYNRNYIGDTKIGSTTVFLATRSVSPTKTIFNWDILSCSLNNASYTVNVTSDSNNIGFLSGPTTHALNNLTFNVSMPTPEPPSSANQPTPMSYLALMESLNRLLVGNHLG